MLQTLMLNNKKRKKSLFYEEKSLVGLTPGKKSVPANAPFYRLRLSEDIPNEQNEKKVRT